MTTSRGKFVKFHTMCSIVWTTEVANLPLGQGLGRPVSGIKLFSVRHFSPWRMLNSIGREVLKALLEILKKVLFCYTYMLLIL